MDGHSAKGAVFIDLKGKVLFARGIGEDPRVRALAEDDDWLQELAEKRLQPLSLDGASYIVLLVPFATGRLLLVSKAPGDTVMEFIGSIDFAYDVVEHLISDPYEAMTVVDGSKRIVYVSPIHEGFFGLRRGDAVGRPVREVIENTKLDRVINTGRREIGEVQRMKGVERVVSRIPIKRDGKVVGAIGRVMFKGPEQLEGMARRITALESEVEFYRREAAELRNPTYGMKSLIGESQVMAKLRADIAKVAPLEIPVLVVGESGTGKELVAHALHRLSHRRDAAMVMVNAGALPATLVESELFGYEAGAFTGAHKKGHRGKFEQAAGGTIFLDEIGDMPLDVQVKLLRVLQDRIVERIGGDRPQEVDFRLVAATNCDLKRLIGDGRFRLDLYYRISAIVIEVPPLRKRAGDIPDLSRHFLAEIAQRHARPMPELTENALSFLMEQSWPGNIRQLRHEIERAFVFAEEGRITADVLAQTTDGWSDPLATTTALAAPAPSAGAAPSPAPKPSTGPIRMDEAVERLEAEVVQQAFVRHRGNKKRMADELGISRSYLYKVLDRNGITDRP